MCLLNSINELERRFFGGQKRGSAFRFLVALGKNEDPEYLLKTIQEFWYFYSSESSRAGLALTKRTYCLPDLSAFTKGTCVNLFGVKEKDLFQTALSPVEIPRSTTFILIAINEIHQLKQEQIFQIKSSQLTVLNQEGQRLGSVSVGSSFIMNTVDVIPATSY
ncbi:hypothetical protein ACFL1U_03530 [Patescibacteria group bacterium]